MQTDRQADTLPTPLPWEADPELWNAVNTHNRLTVLLEQIETLIDEQCLETDWDKNHTLFTLIVMARELCERVGADLGVLINK